MDAEKLLAEWAAKDFLPQIEKGEICQRDYAKLIGSSTDKAARLLEDYVQAGLWTKREALINGRRGLAYKPKAAPKVKRA
jgi:hypothetical protein